ncbi:MAG TPA: acyclic terpene utilization AtuA family protein [Acidobacteriota bacterium]|nr:acyclic terpene utilization AtuA family protein [Acidobacteriota bacterium]
MGSARVRVGNAGGYWGDDPHAMRRQLRLGRLDYLTQDFLAEVTMSILQKQRARDAELGYAVDFLSQLRDSLPFVGSTRIVSNAGGIHPLACALRVRRLLQEASLTSNVAVVTGDDLMDALDGLLQEGVSLANMETGEPLSKIRDRVQSANAYLGIGPVLEALRQGASIIITGRVTDTAMVAAAPAFEFGWDPEDWDKLASAVIAGHILECGAQATGGNITDWRSVPSYQNFGYPIAEFAADGSFVVTKPDATGGMVSQETVISQLIYEMGDPRRYITPDVVADFSTVRLAEEGPNRVRVSGVRGHARPDHLKVSVSFNDGFKAHGVLIVSRPDAVEKSRKIADIFWARLGIDFEETSTELIGYNACHRNLAPPVDPPEILLRLGARDRDRDKLEQFANLFASLILSTVSGVAIAGGRPRIQEVVAYWPCLVPASSVTPDVHLLETGKSCPAPHRPAAKASASIEAPSEETPPAAAFASNVVETELRTICYGRSGDKGDTCNIGIAARSELAYQWIRRHLTAERVRELFAGISNGKVERFELHNLMALNFLLHNSLGGGGTVSLRIDPQGKTLADALLSARFAIPHDVLESVG